MDLPHTYYQRTEYTEQMRYLELLRRDQQERDRVKRQAQIDHELMVQGYK